ncbi:MAG TPA: hopanoid biosynthesis-associated protein HpnK [Steroidobacteraceae bacterium]|nr:hopanoid biosynthesis-associated protein HpnK [Steroidobacteraceae bacterium]
MTPRGPVRRLIVTADDFGAALQVNEAVEAAHRNGVLTAASLMVSAAAAADAIARARRLPALRVGLHLVLVEGRPTLPARSLSRLVDCTGMLRSDMAALGALIAASRTARAQLAAEITAQFEAFGATGLALDHCNAHKHFHLHPVIAGMIVGIGRRFGLRAARVPLEPAALLRKVEPRTPRMAALALLPWALLLRRRFRAAGLTTCDRVLGLRWSGCMSRQRLGGLISNLPAGLSEIYLHPATGPYEGCAPGYHYREELQALTAPEVLAACRGGGFELGGFADFAAARAQDDPAFHRAA